MLLICIGLFICICCVFIFFYMKYIEVNKDLEELYDMYYDLYVPEKKEKGKITVLNRKVGK